MKTFLSILLFCAIPLVGLPQNFSDKTNKVHLNFTQPGQPTTLPTISWTSPRIERSNSMESSITFEATVQSDIPLKEVSFNLTSGGQSKQKAVALGDNEMFKIIQQPIRLVEGENIITLTAENIKGGKVSSVRAVLFGRDAIAEAVDINRRDYALVFATDHYDHFDDLVNPIHDARTISDILKSKYGFQTEVIENATNDEILSKITEYNVKRFNPQDQLFVFFAGHGVFDETLGEGYVVASNSIQNDQGRSTYVSHILIRERLNNIKCEHIFLMMDVCFGGTIDPVLAKGRALEDTDENIDKQFLVKKLTKHTRKFLTSGSKEYVSDGLPGKHSPFAEKFVLALKEIGGGKGRILSLLELQTYFLRLNSEPRFGSFGKDDPASDFVFVAKQ
jgi:hypothetical protein